MRGCGCCPSWPVGSQSPPLSSASSCRRPTIATGVRLAQLPGPRALLPAWVPRGACSLLSIAAPLLLPQPPVPLNKLTRRPAQLRTSRLSCPLPPCLDRRTGLAHRQHHGARKARALCLCRRRLSGGGPERHGRCPCVPGRPHRPSAQLQALPPVGEEKWNAARAKSDALLWRVGPAALSTAWPGSPVCLHAWPFTDPVLGSCSTVRLATACWCYFWFQACSHRWGWPSSPSSTRATTVGPTTWGRKGGGPWC